MKGQYKTKEGKLIQVSNFDAENKIAYADLGDGESRWCPESEYSTWTKDDPHDEVVPMLDDEQVPEEVLIKEPVKITKKEIVIEKVAAKVVKPESKQPAKKKK
jgi:uncharacterized membrane-anchored protein